MQAQSSASMAASLRNGLSAASFFNDVGIINGNTKSASVKNAAAHDFTNGVHIRSSSMTDSWRHLQQFPSIATIRAQASICIPRAMRWWEKTTRPNILHIESPEHLVDSLLAVGDKLVVVDFYSHACGGCKSLHPKVCQLAELHPDAVFLKVNYEEHKAMCYSLGVHVLPFFQLYRGAQGRLCSFSCTIATIKKLKDALVKHGTDFCGVGPPKGLEESELLRLAAHREVQINMNQQDYQQKFSIYDTLTPTNTGLNEELNNSSNLVSPIYQ